MNRFKPSLALRMYRDLCWYIRLFISCLPELMTCMAFGSLFILLPVMAAFVV